MEPQDPFPTTEWTIVLEARETPGETQARALNSLCQAYWQPVFRYVRSRGHPACDAEDLTQGFFQDLLKRNFLAKTHPDAGRFRAFVLASLKNFLHNQWRKSQAAKRFVQAQPVTEDLLETHGADAGPADELFDQSWAHTLVSLARKKLHTEFENAGKLKEFQVLEPFLIPNETLTQTQAAEQLGLSEGGVRIAIHRLRKRFSALVEREVRRIVADSSEVGSEMRYLLDCLIRHPQA
jgi:RNA polymerase sigma factor (sigma-70 family)